MRCAIHAARQLPGKGPTDVDVNQKSDYDIIMLKTGFTVLSIV